jgi:hypothetical protein
MTKIVKNERNEFSGSLIRLIYAFVTFSTSITQQTLIENTGSKTAFRTTGNNYLSFGQMRVDEVWHQRRPNRELEGL